MIEIKVTKEMALSAYNKSLEMGELKNSIRQGKGNFPGFLGEEAVKSYLNLTLGTNTNTYDYDFLYKDKRCEIKSKATKAVPNPNYEASIAAYNTTQKCDYYIFTRVYYIPTCIIPRIVYIMGYIPKQEYFEKAKFLKKGQLDGDNGYVVKADCFNLSYANLHSIEDLLSI